MAAVLSREIARISQTDRSIPPRDGDSVARIGAPAFTYRGYGDPHWRGQGCYLIGPVNFEEREIVLACGCHARVPWWTLEPSGSNTVTRRISSPPGI